MIAIVDCGISNLASVTHAFMHLTEDVLVVTDPRHLDRATHAVLPGVGSFARGMANLQESGFESALKNWHAAKRPLLGICLGMQLLMDHGNEGGDTPGLGLIPGRVDFLQKAPLLPHIGWNDLEITAANTMFPDSNLRRCVYFVHSYVVTPDHSAVVSAWTTHGSRFPSALVDGSTWGCQFHPEKSQADGLDILKRFAALTC